MVKQTNEVHKSETVTACITRQLFSNPRKNWAVVCAETKDNQRITITDSGVKPRRSGQGYKPRKPGADFI